MQIRSGFKLGRKRVSGKENSIPINLTSGLITRDTECGHPGRSWGKGEHPLHDKRVVSAADWSLPENCRIYSALQTH